MSFFEDSKIISNIEISKNLFHMKLASPEIAKNVQPGQFINIKCGDSQNAFLRRPISVFFADSETVEIIYQVKGKGTTLLAQKQSGDLLSILGPLGKGFDTSLENIKIAVLGGGIGIFPLYFLLTKLTKCERVSIIGFRSKEFVVLEQNFAEVSENQIICTDDGTYGIKGLVVKPLEELFQSKLDMVYTCGPHPMIKKVAEMCIEKDVRCQVSMEQRMCCGIGACAVCVCKAKSNIPDKWDYLRVCKNGPVFEATQLIFD